MVIDTSIVLKYFFEEEDGASLARELISEGGLVAPDLLIYECVNVLTVTRNLSLQEIGSYIQTLYGLGIQIFILPEHNFLRVAEISKKYGITAYDASFVVLAESLGVDLVTADEKMVARVKSLGFVKSLMN